MKVALFLPNWIGDLVMATPAIRALRQQFPSAAFLGICKPYVAPTLDGSPWFDRMLFLGGKGRGWMSVARELRRERLDLAVLFPNSFRSAWVSWLAGAKRIVGYDRYLRGWMLTDRLHATRDEKGGFKPMPIIDDYNRLAETVGCPNPGFRMELFTTPSDEQAADEVWRRHGFDSHRETVCLNPGAAFGASKYWQAEHFAKVAQDLTDRRDAQVLVLCGPSERELANRIASLAERPRVKSLADAPLSLGLTKALVKRSTLLVTTDSGPRHFAAAFDRPVVSLFGPTHIEWTETYFAKAIHLQKKVPCGPCQLRVCPTDHRCMKELTPTEVYGAAEELLDRHGRMPVPAGRQAC